MFETLIQDMTLTMPFWLWALLGITLIAVQMLNRGSYLPLIYTVGALFGLLGFSLYCFDPSLNVQAFSGSVVVDSFSQMFNIIGILITIVLVLLMAPGLKDKTKLVQTSYQQFPEFLICLVFTGFGLSVLAASIDLTSLFLGLEILSFGIYCLCGFYRTDIRSTESGFKYLLIGAFSTAFFLYGIAFVYGATGATDYDSMRAVISEGMTPLLGLGVIFLLSGLAFKFALIPFHFYTPDVYEGAPTQVTGFLATMVKVGAVAASMRIFWNFLEPVSAYWTPFWIGLCTLSILIGNIAALQQKTIKRLLAFSSISHAGFMGLALLVASPASGDVFPLFAYIIVYSIMTLGIFGLISSIEKTDEVFHIQDLKGLSQKRLGLSILLAIFVLGLAGIPPLAGFMIKFWVLKALLQQGFFVMALVAIIGSLIGATYYLRILILVFMSEERGAACSWIDLRDKSLIFRCILILTAILTLLGGIRPQLYADWILQGLALK
jgi:NADH-quinone oxidoreductase subunit N